MAEFEYLVRFLAAAVPDLKSYLLSNNVHWNLSLKAPDGMPPYPVFSLGWLLLYRRSLSAAELKPAWKEILDAIDGARTHWRSAWAKKAAREFGVRLNEWSRFINEVRADPAAHRSRYRYEVQRRTILSLLNNETDEISGDQASLLTALDAVLRGNLEPGPFVQNAVFQPAFPENEFWFLYGELK
jgi:hypothetical protein